MKPQYRPPRHIAPKMNHGDANKMADLAAEGGLPLVPWQHELLNQLESASMDQQFTEIVQPYPPVRTRIWDGDFNLISDSDDLT